MMAIDVGEQEEAFEGKDFLRLNRQKVCNQNISVEVLSFVRFAFVTEAGDGHGIQSAS